MGANWGQKLTCMYRLLSVNRRYFKWRSEVCKEIQVAENDLEWRKKNIDEGQKGIACTTHTRFKKNEII